MKRGGDAAIAGEYYFRLGRTYDVLADHERAVDCARRAIEEAERCGDRTVEGKAHFVLAYVGYWTGRYAEGVEHGRQAVAALEGSPERWWLGEAHWVIGINHAMAGEFDPALAALEQAQAIGESLMDPRLQSTVAFTVGGIYALQGASELAIERCRRAVELARDPVGTAVARGFLGASLLEKGDAEGAIPLLERSVEQLGRFRIRQTQGWFAAMLSQACFLAGHHHRARGLAQQALEMTPSPPALSRGGLGPAYARPCRGGGGRPGGGGALPDRVRPHLRRHRRPLRRGADPSGPGRAPSRSRAARGGCPRAGASQQPAARAGRLAL